MRPAPHISAAMRDAYASAAVSIAQRVVGSAPDAAARSLTGGRSLARSSLALYLAVTSGALGIKCAARAAGVTPRHVRAAVARIEDRRDHVAFDAWLDDLAFAMRGAA